MKTIVRSILLVACLIPGVFAVAQGPTPDLLKVKVPFDFYAGNKLMPAGQYELRRVQERNPYLLRLANPKGQSALLYVLHNEALDSENTRFVFESDGHDYVLTSLRTPKESYALPSSQADRMGRVATTQYSISGSN